MEERISIITPDHVELDFEVAGIGSRLLAFIMDQVLLYLGILTLVLLMMEARIYFRTPHNNGPARLQQRYWYSSFSF